MNASGRLNTCKSRGNRVFGSLTTGARVSNAYATYLLLENSPRKRGLMFHNVQILHRIWTKVPAATDGHA